MTLERLYEPYSVRRSCERCRAVDYVARLLVPFSRPVHLCRRCRQVVTGVPDTRNMPSTIQATATIAAAEQLEPVRIAGLLTAGHASDQLTQDQVDWILAPDDESDAQLGDDREAALAAEIAALEAELHDVLLAEIGRRTGGA